MPSSMNKRLRGSVSPVWYAHSKRSNSRTTGAQFSAMPWKLSNAKQNRLRLGNRHTNAVCRLFLIFRDAHKIIVMDEGTIVEAGTHEELLEINGKYKEMYDLQQLEVLVEQGGEG